MEVVRIAASPNLSVTLGQNYLQLGCPIILGISPGNPYYYKRENLQRLLRFAVSNSDKVLLFVPDKIAEHNHRATGSRHPEKSASSKAKELRNKCRKAAREIGLSDSSYNFVRWKEEIETNPEYARAFLIIKNLFQKNQEFRADVQDSTAAALTSMMKRKQSVAKVEDPKESSIDIEEGVNYVFKQLAFLQAVPFVYENWDRFINVYHRAAPVFEKYFGGHYDDVVKPCFGYFILD